MFFPFLVVGADDAAIAVAVIGLIGALAATVGGAASQHATNKANQEINQRNLDYQTQQTQASWERDDNYYQRSVADAQAAGLSPLAINGAMPNTAPLSAPNPIGMQSPFDSSSLMNTMLGSLELGETKRSNIKAEEQRAEEISNDAKEIAIKAQSLTIENKKVEADIKHQANLIKLETRRIAETERANKKSEDFKEKQYNLEKASFESKRYFEEIKHQTGGEDIPYKTYDNFEEYLTARDIYLSSFNEFLDSISQTSTADMHSKNGGAGGSVTGTGLNIQAGATDYHSENWSEKQKMMYDKFRQSHPVPVFYYKAD